MTVPVGYIYIYIKIPFTSMTSTSLVRRDSTSPEEKSRNLAPQGPRPVAPLGLREAGQRALQQAFRRLG